MFIYIFIYYWIVCYVVAACVFVSRPNPCFLRQIPVFIRQCLRVTVQMVLFLLSSSLMGYYSLDNDRLPVKGGGRETMVGGIL